jgi:anti-sigma factor RsiW
MKCNKVRNNLIVHLDGKLDQNLSNEINQHLANCPDCRKELTLLRESWKALDEFTPIDAPSDFSQKVLKRAEQEAIQPTPQKMQVFPGWLPYVASAAVFVFLFIGTLVYFSYNPVPPDLDLLDSFVMDEMGITGDTSDIDLFEDEPTTDVLDELVTLELDNDIAIDELIK